MDSKRVFGYGCLVCGLLGMGSSQIEAATSRPTVTSTTGQSPTVAAAAASSYGPLWTTAGGYSTVLILKNPGLQPATATVQLYSVTGQQVGTTQVQLSPGSSSQLSLASLVSSGTGIAGGGLSIQWGGSAQQTTGQVVITDPNGGTVSYAVQGGYRYDTENALSAPWWLPDAGSDGSVTLFNTSAQTIVVSPSITVNGVRKPGGSVAVAANASQALNLRALMEKSGVEVASVGSITLHYTGAAHALEPSLVLSNAQSGFALMPDFSASHQQQAQQQTNWQFPYVALAVEGGSSSSSQGVLTAYALLSNQTRTQMTPQITAYTVSEGRVQQVPISITALGPQETRLLDLSQVAQQLPSLVSRLALTVSHPGQPGDLGISIFGVNPSNQVISRSEGLILPASGVSVSYWDVSTDRVLMHQIESTTGGSATGQATLFYQTPGGLGSYGLPATLTVNDNKARLVSMTQIIRAGVPDDDGSRMSPGVTSGLLVLSAPGAAPVLANSLATCSTSCNTQPRSASPQTASAQTASPQTTSSAPIAFANKAVKPLFCPPPSPSLSCTSSVTRGGSATCTVSGASSASSWSFVDSSGNTVTTSTTSLTWSGVMVTGGTVSVTASGVPLMASIAVNNRTNFAFTAVNPSQVMSNTLNCYSGGGETLTSPPIDNHQGASCVDLAFSFVSAAPISDGGPNNGYQYITSASSTSSDGTQPTKYEFIVVSDLLSSTTFFNAQCGNFSSSNLSGFIAGSQLNLNVFDHEQGSVLSHWTEYRDAQNQSSNNIGTVLETEIATPGTPQTTFSSQASSDGTNALNRINTASTTEPCGGSTIEDSSQSCKSCGAINYSPYTSCGGAQPVPHCQ